MLKEIIGNGTYIKIRFQKPSNFIHFFEKFDSDMQEYLAQNRKKKGNPRCEFFSGNRLLKLSISIIHPNLGSIRLGMRESLEWLKESLEESLEDRDEESNEGIALVPLTANSSAAIDSPTFQRFLRGSEIHAPDLEEAYWRIPATMLVATIKKRIAIIDAALKGEFIEEGWFIE